MSGELASICVLDAGSGHARGLKEMRERLERVLDLPVRIERQPLDLARAYDSGRQQYNSSQILAQILEQAGPPTEKRIAVVGVDLFIPVLTFVFGEAQLGGSAAVVSLRRLGNPFYGLPRDDAVLLERLAKEIVHELGHTLGLYHCRQFECVMRSSTYVEEIDLKREHFCPGCRARLGMG